MIVENNEYVQKIKTYDNSKDNQEIKSLEKVETK